MKVCFHITGALKSLSSLNLRFKHLSKYYSIVSTAGITTSVSPSIRKFHCFANSCLFQNHDENMLEELSEKELSSLKPSVEEYLPRGFRIAGMPHNVLIIQPVIKWGPSKDRSTPPQLKLDEAVSLIETLPKWQSINTEIISLTSFDKKMFFNSGQLETLKELVKSHEGISAVFVNVKKLKISQHLFLENHFGVPVFDRYNVIINIFKHHAKTKEAKLQVALAEIPYILSKIRGINEEESCGLKNIGSNETYKEKRLGILTEFEQKIKTSIAKLKKNRELQRNKRNSLRIPIIAVVGYTNAGKTSLIKALTGEKELEPEDKLFATLDTTFHAGFLPRNLKVLFVDTIGFISDIPTNLFEPFKVTLEDAMRADVIVIVQDVSHPDCKTQFEVVMSTLREFNLDKSVMENIVVVGNKCDKTIAENNGLPDNSLRISCKEMSGMDDLREKIEDSVIKATGLLKLTFRVLSGGVEFSWLLKETSVYLIDVDPKNEQYCYLSTLISEADLNIFKKNFIPKPS